MKYDLAVLIDIRVVCKIKLTLNLHLQNIKLYFSRAIKRFDFLHRNLCDAHSDGMLWPIFNHGIKWPGDLDLWGYRAFW